LGFLDNRHGFSGARQGRADPSLGVKNKKPLARRRMHERGVREIPDQRLCWWRPPLDAEFVTRRPVDIKAIFVPV
jgi:hypothetical protein